MLKLKCWLKSPNREVRRSGRLLAVTGIVVTGAMLFSPTAVRAEAPTSYTVVAGDYLYGIAQRHKVKLDALLAVNGLEASSLILPGMTLQLPAGASAPAAAAAAPKAAAPSSATASGATYTVVAGDYLYGIASKNRVRLNDLMAVNGLELTSVIHPGMTLKLPGAAGSSAAAAAPTTTAAPAAEASGGDYVIKAGDSLYAIARRHGVTLNALLAANGIEATDLILPGRTLKLPAGATGAAPSTNAPTATTAAPASGSSGLVYTVRPNDSLSLIASRANTRLSALLALNGLTMSSMIHPGDQLKLPEGSTMPSANPEATTAPSASAQPAAQANIAATGNSQIDAVLAFTRAQLGKPYKFFTAGPDTYDCSGLVKAAFATIGLALPHQSYAQSKFGTPVDWRNEPIKAGDLVFKYSSTNLSVISHVGIAISSTQMIHAPNAGSVVKVAAIPAANAIVAVQRLIP